MWFKSRPLTSVWPSLLFIILTNTHNAARNPSSGHRRHTLAHHLTPHGLPGLKHQHISIAIQVFNNASWCIDKSLNAHVVSYPLTLNNLVHHVEGDETKGRRKMCCKPWSALNARFMPIPRASWILSNSLSFSVTVVEWSVWRLAIEGGYRLKQKRFVVASLVHFVFPRKWVHSRPYFGRLSRRTLLHWCHRDSWTSQWRCTIQYAQVSVYNCFWSACWSLLFTFVLPKLAR